MAARPHGPLSDPMDVVASLRGPVDPTPELVQAAQLFVLRATRICLVLY